MNIESVEDKVITRYGIEKLKEAQERLCKNCVRFYESEKGESDSPYDLGCWAVLPLTSDGNNCPYFKQVQR